MTKPRPLKTICPATLFESMLTSVVFDGDSYRIGTETLPRAALCAKEWNRHFFHYQIDHLFRAYSLGFNVIIERGPGFPAAIRATGRKCCDLLNILSPLEREEIINSANLRGTPL